MTCPHTGDTKCHCELKHRMTTGALWMIIIALGVAILLVSMMKKKRGK